MTDKPVNSIQEFIEKIQGLPEIGESKFYLCGHSQSSYKLMPSVFRDPWHDHWQSEMLSELVSIQPREFSDDRYTFDTLVRAQHHGLPTRLLDITTNPLFALYFACAEPLERQKRRILLSLQSRSKKLSANILIAIPYAYYQT